MSTALVRAAPAKINLALHVVGRRPDSYHLLDSLVAFTDYGDTIAAEPADDLSLAIDGPFAAGLDPADSGNLVQRAARLLAETAGRHPGAALRLTKRLPVASGIGGGSADAAATLRVLAALWRIELAEADLAALALPLGADLPVCLAGATTRVRGIGEALAPCPALPPVPIVLVNPGRPLPTQAVFKARQGPFGDPLPAALATAQPADAAALADLLRFARNDLTAAAIAVEPTVAAVLDAFGRTSGCLVARMCGSGATCFGLYPDAAAADAAVTIMRASNPGWWSVATRLAGN